MTDPVTNIEIEDVLSSIRRLVSEKNRKETPEPSVPGDAEEDRLILTPSLRVSAPEECDDSQELPSEETAQPDANAPETTPDFSRPLELTPSLLAEPAIEETPDNSQIPDQQEETAQDARAWTPVPVPESTPEAASQTHPETSVEPVPDLSWGDDGDVAESEGTSVENHVEAGQDIGREEPATQDSAPESGPVSEPRPEGIWQPPDAILFRSVQRHEDDEEFDIGAADGPVAEPQEAPFVLKEVIDAQGGETDGPSAGTVEVAGNAGNHAPESEQEPERKSEPEAEPETGLESGLDTAELPPGLVDPPASGLAPENESETGPDWKGMDRPEEISTGHNPRLSSAASLSAKIEALEAAIAETQDQWEPDGEGGDDYAGTENDPIAWREQEKSEPPAVPPMDTVSRQDTSSAPSVPGSSDAILDEESLRELVNSLLREELQGALGERITRNVRKLVRREIQRALTAQELD